jgi:hypothetical protein
MHHSELKTTLRECKEARATFEISLMFSILIGTSKNIKVESKTKFGCSILKVV